VGRGAREGDETGRMVFVTKASGFSSGVRRSARTRQRSRAGGSRVLASAFAGHADSLARYDRGEFLYSPADPSLPIGYGDAVVPWECLWDGFELLDFITDESRCL